MSNITKPLLAETIEEFFRVLWTPGDLVEIRVLPSSRSNGRGPESFFWLAEELPDHVGELKRLNEAGMHIYAGVLPRRAPGGTKDADCLGGWAVWQDFDKTTLPEVEERISASGMPRPTLAVDSGHGIHAYWSMKDRTAPEALSSLVADLAGVLESDRSVRNPGRLMRLPGYMNWKPPERPCSILYEDDRLRYSFTDLREMAPAWKPAEGQARSAPPGVPPPPGDREALIERGRRYAATVPGSKPGGRTNTAFKVAAALANDLRLSEAEVLPILEGWDGAANHPSIADTYGPEELAKILRNATTYHKHPPGRLLTPPPAGRGASPPRKIPTPSEAGEARQTLESLFASEGRGERRSISFPWSRLTDLSAGLRPGSVVILGGPPGYGKSLFVLHLSVHAHGQGARFALLPLEGRKLDAERRLLAHLAGTWAVIDDDPKEAELRQSLLGKYRAKLTELARGISENPRLPVVTKAGPTVPALPYSTVLDWITRSAEEARIIMVDPLAQIDFGERNEWKGQGDFARKCCGIAAASGVSIFIVAHTLKRPGKSGTIPLTGEDIQGAAELRRLTDLVLLLDAHDEKESEVWRPGGCRETVVHDRTVIVDKARHGRGAGQRLAFTLDGPAFRELGIVAPRGPKKTYSGGNPTDLAYKD